MKVEVLLDRVDAQPVWIVCSGAICIRFNSEVAARTYAQTLESRLNAPHAWPGRHESFAPTPAMACELQPPAV